MKSNKIFVAVLLILLVISTLMSLTLEEERKLRKQGIEFKEAFTLGEREFSQNNPSQKSFAQIVDDHIFLTRNVKIETNDIILRTSDKDTYVVFTKGDFSSKYENYIQIYEENGIKKVVINGKEIKVKKVKEKLEFVLDDKGEFDEGTSFTSIKDTYNLRGYTIPLPDNSNIEFLKDRIIVNVPSGSFIEPSVEDVEKVNGILQFKTQGIGYLGIRGERFQLADNNGQFSETTVFYNVEEGKLVSYFEEKFGTFLNENNNPEFSFINPRSVTDDPKTYLVFEGSNIKEPYILVTKDRIGTVSYKGEGAAINILPGNRFGAGINVQGGSDLESGKRTLSFFAKDGYAILIRGETGKIPTLIVQNSFYWPDKKTFYSSGNEIYYYDDVITHLFNHGDNTIALQTIFLDKDGNRIKNVDVFSTNENNYVWVPAGKLKGPLEYFVGEKGTVVSSSLVINQLTPKARKTYTELAEEEQQQLNQILQQGGVGGLEIQLAKIEEKRSPLKASVSLGGCTGTIVGYGGNKAYVITAAHCYGFRSGGSASVRLNSLDKKSGSPGGGPSLRGRVVAVSNADVALVEIPLSDDVRQRGYVKIPSNPNFARIGDKVVRIGCRTGTVGCRVTGVDNYVGQNSLDTSSSPPPKPGDSGGGLFKGRYIVGVTQTTNFGSWGGYGNLKSIHNLLNKNGYSFLYKIIIIVLEKNNYYLMVILLLLYKKKKV